MNRLAFTPILFLATMMIFVPAQGIGASTELYYSVTVATADGNWKETQGILMGSIGFEKNASRMWSINFGNEAKPKSSYTKEIRIQNPNLDNIAHIKVFWNAKDERTSIEVKHVLLKSLKDGTEKRLCFWKHGEVRTPAKVFSHHSTIFDTVC